MNLSITSKPELQNESAVLMNSPKDKMAGTRNDGFVKELSKHTQEKLINIVIGESSLNVDKLPARQRAEPATDTKKNVSEIISHQYSFKQETFDHYYIEQVPNGVRSEKNASGAALQVQK